MMTAAEPPPGVDLSREPDFRLGVLAVSPSACRVRGPAGDQRVEPRVMEVLVVLVRSAGATVTRDRLIEVCWGGRIVSDDAVTRAVARVRTLARGLDPAPFSLETVPKVGFRLVPSDGEARGLSGPAPPVTAGKASGRAAGSPGRRRVLVVGVVAVLLAASAGWAVWLGASGIRSPKPTPMQNGRVEVMLFEPVRADPALQPLSIALADAVIGRLASDGVQTTQRPSQRGDGASAGAAEFRVAGTVDRDGGKYLINGQIVDRRSGLVLWSAQMVRPVNTATGFHEEAASDIASLLHCGLAHREAARKPMGAAVFGLFLNACAASWERNAQMLEVARRLVQAAPNLSGAHSMYAMAAAQLALSSEDSQEDIGALHALARDSANRALKLDPENGEAYLALALASGEVGNWAVRERYFERALALDRGPAPGLMPARELYINFLREVGRLNSAVELNARMIDVDPLSSFELGRLAMLNAALGDLPRAQALLHQADLIRPGESRDVRWVIAVYWEDPKAARAKVRQLGQGYMKDADVLCFDKFLERLPHAKAGGARGLPAECARVTPDARIRMLSRQGDVDGAYAELAKPDPRWLRSTIFLFYPEMKAFRQDARFMPLARRLGLADYWRETDRWPDFCAEPDLPYDCRAEAARLTATPSR